MHLSDKLQLRLFPQAGDCVAVGILGRGGNTRSKFLGKGRWGMGGGGSFSRGKSGTVTLLSQGRIKSPDFSLLACILGSLLDLSEPLFSLITKNKVVKRLIMQDQCLLKEREDETRITIVIMPCGSKHYVRNSQSG